MSLLAKRAGHTFSKLTKAPWSALAFVLRRAVPFGIRFKDMEAYRISGWSHGALPRVTLTEAFPGIEDRDVIVRRAYDRAIGTSVDTYECLVICAIERHIKAKRALEIGTWDGNTALNLAANIAEGGKVVTVDLPPDWDGKLRYSVPKGYRNITDRQRVGIQYRRTPEEKRIIQVLGDSATIDWKRLGGPFDLIFIDGCHHLDYVRRDTENALRVLRKGGVLIWHDYGMIKDVSKVVDGYARTRTVNSIRGTRLAVMKK